MYPFTMYPLILALYVIRHSYIKFQPTLNVSLASLRHLIPTRPKL